MGYCMIASIGRPYILPLGRSGLGSRSGRCRGSRGGIDSLPSDKDEEVSNAEIRGEEEE